MQCKFKAVYVLNLIKPFSFTLIFGIYNFNAKQKFIVVYNLANLLKFIILTLHTYKLLLKV